MNMVFLIEVPHTGRVSWRYGESLIAIAWEKCEHDGHANGLWVDDYEETEDGAREYLCDNLYRGIVIRTEEDLINEYRRITDPDRGDRHQRFGIIAALEEIADFVNRNGFADTEIKLPGRATEDDEEDEDEDEEMMIKNLTPVPKTASRFPEWIKTATKIKCMYFGTNSIGLAVIRGDVVLFHWNTANLTLEDCKKLRKENPFRRFVYIGTCGKMDHNGAVLLGAGERENFALIME